MAKLATSVAVTNAGLVNLTDQFGSMIKITRNKFHHLDSEVLHNQEAINDLWTTTTQTNVVVNSNLKYLNFLMAEMYFLLGQTNFQTDFYAALQNLLSGRLSQQIVPFSEMKKAIKHINSELTRQGYDLEVIQLSPARLYRTIDFIWGFQNNQITITTKIPLVQKKRGDFHIYNFQTFSVPATEDSLLNTRLVHKPTLLALNLDSRVYAFLTEQMIQKDHIDSVKFGISLAPMDHKSCLVAIFFDDNEIIKEMCKFTISHEPLTSTVTYISEAQYLVQSTPEIWFECPSALAQPSIGRQKRTGCQFCLIKSMCGCALVTHTQYFAPKLEFCSTEVARSEYQYPVNLAMLLHFSEQLHTVQVQASTLLEHQPTITLPQIAIRDKSNLTGLPFETTDDLDLAAVASSVKNQKEIFTSVQGSLHQQIAELKIENEFVTLIPILLASLSLLLHIITAGILCYLGWRLSKLTTILATLQHMQPIDAAYVVNTPFNLVPTVPAETSHSFPLYTTLDIIIKIVSFILLFFYICKFIHGICNRFHKASINLNISTGQACVSIPIYYLTGCPEIYHLCQEKCISNIEVTGWLKPTLSWTDNGLTLISELDFKRYRIPTKIQMTWYTAWYTKKLLRSRHVTQVTAMHDGQNIPLSICFRNEQCDTCTTAWKLKKEPILHSKFNLYPPLPSLPSAPMTDESTL